MGDYHDAMDTHSLKNDLKITHVVNCVQMHVPVRAEARKLFQVHAFHSRDNSRYNLIARHLHACIEFMRNALANEKNESICRDRRRVHVPFI